MPTEKLTFTGHAGDKLSARFDRAEGPELAVALFAHCFTCGKDNAAARRIAMRLASMGISVLRFDFTGLGQSEGAFEETTFTSNTLDLIAAAAVLREMGHPVSMLIGHSLGGAAVLAAAKRIEGIKAVVTLCAPFDPDHITRNFEGALERIAADGMAEVTLAGRKLKIGKEFVTDIQGTSIAAAIATLNAALLVMHAPRDEIVGIDNAARIFAAAMHPKSFVTLDDADHMISRTADAVYAAEVIAAWSARYLKIRTPAPPSGAPEGIIRVSEADPDGFLQYISGGPRHLAVADEPLAHGGTDQGMSPYGFLAAGLGACTAMTLRMYARRKGLPLKHVSVDVTHNKVHAEDAGGMTPARIDKFTRHITVEGMLSEAERDRLLEIADMCPVHRTLEGSALIETTLVWPQGG